MRWTDPPTRRELVLVLLSLTVFSLSYTFAATLSADNADDTPFFGTRRKGAVGGTKSDSTFDAVLPDELDDVIFGVWDVKKNTTTATVRVVEKYGAMWVERTKQDRDRDREEVRKAGMGTANEGFVRWGKGVPVSSFVWHVPGYTILDNVVLFKGKVYIVTDDQDAFPPVSAIVAAWGPGINTWEVVSVDEARRTVGTYGGMIRGVSWMSADTTPHNSTLLALWRAYSSLLPSPSSLSSANNTTNTSTTNTTPTTPPPPPLPPPARLIFPHLPVFTDPNPLKHFHHLRRRRADTGFHPFTLKAAFPALTVLYQDDWADFHAMGTPFVMQRVVVADREAAAAEAQRRARVGERPAWAGVFGPEGRGSGMGMGAGWMESVRAVLDEYLGAREETGKGVVTYVHRQNADAGLRLRDADHEALVRGLKGLEREQGGWEVHVVSSSSRPDGVTGWSERMGAIVRSSVVLGVAHNDLLDAAFMKPGPHATLMEFFPEGGFIRDEEVVLRSRGVEYIAWWFDRKFTSDELPPVKELSSGDDGPEEVRIDVDRVVQAVREVLTS